MKTIVAVDPSGNERKIEYDESQVTPVVIFTTDIHELFKSRDIYPALCVKDFNSILNVAGTEVS